MKWSINTNIVLLFTDYCRSNRNCLYLFKATFSHRDSQNCLQWTVTHKFPHPLWEAMQIVVHTCENYLFLKLFLHTDITLQWFGKWKLNKQKFYLWRYLLLVATKHLQRELSSGSINLAAFSSRHFISSLDNFFGYYAHFLNGVFILPYKYDNETIMSMYQGVT